MDEGLVKKLIEQYNCNESPHKACSLHDHYGLCFKEQCDLEGIIAARKVIFEEQGFQMPAISPQGKSYYGINCDRSRSTSKTFQELLNKWKEKELLQETDEKPLNLKVIQKKDEYAAVTKSIHIKDLPQPTTMEDLRQYIAKKNGELAEKTIEIENSTIERIWREQSILEEKEEKLFEEACEQKLSKAAELEVVDSEFENLCQLDPLPKAQAAAVSAIAAISNQTEILALTLSETSQIPEEIIVDTMHPVECADEAVIKRVKQEFDTKCNERLRTKMSKAQSAEAKEMKTLRNNKKMVDLLRTVVSQTSEGEFQTEFIIELKKGLKQTSSLETSLKDITSGHTL